MVITMLRLTDYREICTGVNQVIVDTFLYGQQIIIFIPSQLYTITINWSAKVI